MLYKYEDTFINEIVSYKKKNRHIIYDIIKTISIMGFIMIVVYIIGMSMIDKDNTKVYDECRSNLSINNCYVISTSK